MGAYTGDVRPRRKPRSERLGQDRPRHVALVWIDAREAVVARWSGEAADLEHLASDVPARHRSTGHLRHRPEIRHGGGRPSQSALERHRQEHLARFIDEVARRLPDDEDVLILGPGHVRDRLARRMAWSDIQHRVERSVSVEPGGRLSRRQIIARIRAINDATPPRQKVEGYP